MESASNVFDRLRKEVEARASRGGFYTNENLLKLKIGEKYKLRLLWIPAPKGIDRENPMINQYVHRFWDNNAIGTKNIEVFCKTSQYDEGETKAGWECPICKEMSNVYKEYSSSQSKSAKEIYDTFRRTFRGYVPVYVISGPAEDQGKVKILQYTKSFKDFFDLKIFGITKPVKDGNNQQNQIEIDEDEILSINAFTYYEPKDDTVKLEAYDFVVTVGAKTIPIKGRNVQVPDYKFDFTRKMSEIDFGWDDDITEHYLKLSEKIGFDKDFLKKSTTEELEAFLNKYIKNTDISSEVEEDVPGTVQEEVENPHLNKMKEMAKATSRKVNDEDDINLDLKKEEKPAKKTSKSVKVEKSEPVEEEPEENEDSSSNSGEGDGDEEIDIEDLLSGL